MTKLPSGWRIESLGNCCQIVSGSTPSRSKPEYWDGNISWVTPKDLSNLKSPILEDTPEKITEAGYKSCSTTLMPTGTILFSSRAPIGYVAIAGKPMCSNQGFKNLVPNSSVCSAYLYWCMRYFARNVAALGTGTTFKEVSKGVMEKFQIPLPPLEEQRRIAAILDKADAVRRKRQSAIALTEQLLRSAFLEMFGDPVTNPKGWEVHKLVDLTSKIGSGSTPRGGEASYKSDGIPLIRSMNVYDYSFEYRGLAYIDEGQAKALNHVTVTKNDVLLNITGASVARCTIVPSSLTPARVNQHVAIIRTKLHLLKPSYLLSLINSTSFKKKLLSIGSSKGATREALTKDELQNLFIPVPPIHLQEQFASITDKLMSCGKQHLKMEQESSNLFNILLQRAFRGQL